MVFHAKRPDITRFNWLGRNYEIYDAFQIPQAAVASVRAFQDGKTTIYPKHRTLAIYVNLGKEAGRLRYAVFVSRSAQLFQDRRG
jgi:hypothetical protein